jgi:hypothetical protein
LGEGRTERQRNDYEGRDKGERWLLQVKPCAAEDEQSGANGTTEATRGAMARHLPEASQWAKEDLVEIIVEASRTHYADEGQDSESP